MRTETNAERLEKIKDNCERLARYEKHYGSDDVNITPIVEDLQWLIEQAERVQELEKNIKINCDALKFACDDLTKSQYENVKLREALKFYADEQMYYGSPKWKIFSDSGDIARQALEGIDHGKT